jgi:hypothetical protein
MRLAILAWFVAACGLLVGCGDGGTSAGGQGSDASATGRQRSADDFVSVTIEGVGSQSSVQAPGILVLEDLEGQERFELTTEEYGQVLDVVLDPEFVEAIANPSLVLKECHTISDGGYIMHVVWADIGTQATPWGPCMDANHPYQRLLSVIGELFGNHFDCQVVCPMTDGPVRQLCQGC